MRPTHRRALVALPALTLVAGLGAGGAQAAPTAVPASQPVVVPTQPNTTTITWTGTIPATAGAAGAATGACPSANAQLADTETVTLTLPAGLDYAVSSTQADFSITWDAASGNDEVLTVAGPGGSGGSSDTSSNTETVTLGNPAAGTYTARACGFAQVGPQPYTGKLVLKTVAAGTTPVGGGGAMDDSPTLAGHPTYVNYPAPAGAADGGGEPSIGNDHVHDTTVFQSDLNTYQVTTDPTVLANGSTGTSTWLDKSPAGGVTSLDPILFTDTTTGRTVVSQLLGGCSRAVFADDIRPAIPTYTPSEGCGLGTVFDHQTVGGGPYTAGSAFGAAAGAAGYKTPAGVPHSVFYCAQAAATASCARSDDGGVTFGSAVPIYNVPGVNNNDPLGCAGLHGHLRVAPDGSVYVPNFDCDGKVAASVSENDGTTWAVRPVPSSTTQDESDPSIAAGSGGTLYMGWEEGPSTTEGSKAFVGVSRDHGKSWTDITDVGARFGINNIQFPEVIAGDDNRAAYAFIGTPTAGNDQSGSAVGTPAAQVFPGVFHLYVATTYDGGKTWGTVDATPTDPVQRGCVWLGGGSTSCRNLLDFNDITLDKRGAILVGWADGCLAACVNTPLPGDQAYDSAANKASYRAKHGTVTKQVTGKTLFKANDASTTVVPPSVVPEVPVAILLPLVGVGVVAAAAGARRRRRRRALA